MVLDAAFDDAPPASDGDPFNSSGDAPTTQTLKIDLSQASRPFPIMGPLLGFNNKNIVKMTSDIAHAAPAILGRPITQDEVDACVTAVSKYQQIHSWVYANGLILGFFRARATQAEGKWPLQRLLSNGPIRFNFSPYLQSFWQRAAWNGARTLVWMGWWGFPAYVVGGIMGQAWMASAQLTDKRLAKFHEDMRQDASKKRLGEAISRNRQGLPQKGRSEIEAQMDDLSDAKSNFGADDMSPQSAGNFGVGGTTTEPMKTPAFGQPAAAQQASQDSRGDFRSSNRSTPTSQPPPQQSPSPGGSAWDRIRGQASQTGSAWDRIRSGQSGTSDQDASPQSFSFDERDEERQLARSEAQREFDARLDRERSGKDFDDARSSRRQ